MPARASDIPTVLVVFGATGDLMARKIVPSVFHLYQHGRLPEHFRVVGYARRPFPDDVFRDRVEKELIEHHGKPIDAKVMAPFLQMFGYAQGQFDDAAAYEGLGECLKKIDDEWGLCSNKLFYLAVPPSFYRTIFQRLADSGLTRPCSDNVGWTRVLVEKPFGKDEKTAQELDELLGSLFKEEQIYRIDHYLAKEMLQGILNFRFSNNLLEPSWNNSGVDRIEISLLESLGVEDRGDTYDGLGAFRDVGQNHLLQMLALIAMDQPKTRSARDIRAARAELLRSLRTPAPASIGECTFRAQYEGFRQIEGVAPDSDTETYFRIRAHIDNKRWAGVPVTMEAGKRIGSVRKEVVVTFKHPGPCLCEEGQHYENKVTLTLEPEESIRIEFFTKKPGFEKDLEAREFNFFLYEREDKQQYVEEYSKLLRDAILGDQTSFVSTDEVRAMWEFTDPIVCGWAANDVPLETYVPDTDEALILASRIACERFIFPDRRRNEIGLIGLGKMGGGIARHLAEQGWRVVAYNRHVDKADRLAAEEPNAEAAHSLADLAAAMKPPRIIWLMLPAGATVDEHIFGEGGLTTLLEPGDIIIDGGNSHYKDSESRGVRLEKLGFTFVDVGVSGGPEGARNGACVMIGGQREAFDRLQPLWQDLSLEGAYRFFPGYGAGHFVKMVHNGIEYGMMQALAEGFSVLRASPYQPDLIAAAEIYNDGSVVESRLVGWLIEALERHGKELEGVTSVVGTTGEGGWTVDAARELGVPAPVIDDALRFRMESEKNPSYAGRLLSAMRESFGGHAAGNGSKG